MINYKKIIFFNLFILTFFLFIRVGRVYAMEILDERIEQAMEESNPKQYEMNVILMNLGIKDWRWASDASDEIDNPVDEPLGEYSREELLKYTDRDLEIKIDYGFGRVWEGKNEKFIQVIRIYEKGELMSCSYNVWRACFVDDGGDRLRYPRM